MSRPTDWWGTRRNRVSKRDLLQFLEERAAYAWQHMGSTGGYEYQEKLNTENYEFGYFRAIEDIATLLFKDGLGALYAWRDATQKAKGNNE